MAGDVSRLQTKLSTMSSISNGLSRLVKTTLFVGVPLTLLGMAMGWNMHPGGEGLIIVVALIPSVLIATRHILPSEFFWLAFPFIQFVYYFLWVSFVFGIMTIFKVSSNKA